MQTMDNLKKLGKLDQANNDGWKKFQQFNSAVMAQGAISVKNKELIALAVALTTQCNYCLELHRQGAEKAGASQEEIAETILIAGALRAGAALTHGTQILAD
jgi:AhpD family alkylhydroperoxidase